nr:RecName: Full=Uricase; AltName: Full=Urate oxidase [Puccinia recondita f. sp. triseti]
APFSLATA